MIFNPQTVNRCKACGIETTQFHPNTVFSKKQMREMRNLKCPVCKSETNLIWIRGYLIRSEYGYG